MNMLLFVVLIFIPRYKFQFIWWRLNKFYEKEVAHSLCDKVRQLLNKIFESYGLYLSKRQCESTTQEIELVLRKMLDILN